MFTAVLIVLVLLTAALIKLDAYFYQCLEATPRMAHIPLADSSPTLPPLSPTTTLVPSPTLSPPLSPTSTLAPSPPLSPTLTLVESPRPRPQTYAWDLEEELDRWEMQQWAAGVRARRGPVWANQFERGDLRRFVLARNATQPLFE